MNSEVEKTAVSIGGISTFTLLGVAFVILKLTGVIGWSWWWVSAPFWIPAVFAVLMFIFAVGIIGLVYRVARK